MYFDLLMVYDSVMTSLILFLISSSSFFLLFTHLNHVGEGCRSLLSLTLLILFQPS